MKNNINPEDRVLSSLSLDELIKIKMEEEVKHAIDKSSQKLCKETVKDISKVPKSLIFSKSALYRLFSRKNKSETFINGLQAEAMLGLQNNVREKMLNGEMDAFSTDCAYVKFEKIEC